MIYVGESFWGSLSKLYRCAIENESFWFYTEFKFAYLCLTITIKMVSPWQPILLRNQLSLRWFSFLISRSISWSIAYQCVFISNGKNVTLLFKSQSNKKRSEMFSDGPRTNKVFYHLKWDHCFRTSFEPEKENQSPMPNIFKQLRSRLDSSRPSIFIDRPLWPESFYTIQLRSY